MPRYVDGVELTQEGMHEIFARMGHLNIHSGTIYNGTPTIDQVALNAQGFMPVLTGVGPHRTSGHWIMLIKGQGNNYYLFDPLGEASGTGYRDTLAAQLPGGAHLSVIPNGAGLNMGLCGYWVASVGLRAHVALNQPAADLAAVGQTATQEMTAELGGNGYTQITGWLRAVADDIPVAADPQRDATTLRQATEKDLHIDEPVPVVLSTVVATKPSVVVKKAPKPSPDSDTVLQTDADILHAINYAHTEYLGKDYPGPLVDPTDPSKGRIRPNEGTNRGPHGLAHTVRTMAAAEMMVEEARKARFRGETLGTAKNGQTVADVTPEELKKILIAQTFFVAGRDDERSGIDEKTGRNFYDEYHEQSEQAFRKYVQDHNLIGKVFKDQKEVDNYAAIIRDNPTNWDGTPAHMLINQGHMVDLMRVKVPAEPLMEIAYDILKNAVGSQGAEIVLNAHREFLIATGAVVPLFSPQGKEPDGSDSPNRGGHYQDPFNAKKYVVKDDKSPNFKKDLRQVNSNYSLKGTERFVTIKEYYSIPEVQKAFPGHKTFLEGTPYYMPTSFSITCEQNPLACLGAIQQVRAQVKLDPVQDTFQPAPSTARRAPNADEIAAAGIIKKILANPDSIQADHVLLNGQKLEEQFFRDLLAKCDMALVGDLLNDTDFLNVDQLMKHERGTQFHEPGWEKSKGLEIGRKWGDDYRTDPENRRSTPVHSIKMSIIYMMQDSANYYKRFNAVAQGRDTQSSFKEVLLSALLMPLTDKSITDVQLLEYKKQVASPRVIHKGLMGLPPAFMNKLLDQSEGVSTAIAEAKIANSRAGLFSDFSAPLFPQMKITQLSKILAKTCSSTTDNLRSVSGFLNGNHGTNIRLDIEDSDGLLGARRVGAHGPGAENEYSVYIPDDVALIPIEVIRGEPNVIRLIAVKSPDFAPNHQSGFAVEPFTRIEGARLTEVIDNAMKQGVVDLDKTLQTLQTELQRQAALPTRGFFDRLSHSISLAADRQISPERRTFLRDVVLPRLRECSDALAKNDLVALQQALEKLPTDAQWAAFKSIEATEAKAEIDVLKQQVEKKIVLENQILPALRECRDALALKNVDDALKALAKLPDDKKISVFGDDLKRQITGVRNELMSLQHAVAVPLVIDAQKMSARYEALLEDITKQVVDFEKVKPADVSDVRKAISDMGNLQESLNFMRNEKIRMHADPKKPVDNSDITALQERIQIVNQRLVTSLLTDVEQFIATIKDPASFDKAEKNIKLHIALLTELEKSLDGSPNAVKQKADLVRFKDSFSEKQKAFPEMLQLQHKAENLITQLRQIATVHHAAWNEVIKERLDQVQPTLRGLLDPNKGERINLRMKQLEMGRFAHALSDPGADIFTLLGDLAKKKPDELKRGLGVSKENAGKLHELLQLDLKTIQSDKLKEAMDLMDKLSGTLGSKPEPMPVKAKVIEEERTVSYSI